MDREINREKVIKGLECCLAVTKCGMCPYNIENNLWCGNNNQLLEDALVLLKAQEAVEPTVEHNPAGQPMWCCGNCGTTLFFKFPRQTDDEDQRSIYGFCNYCGRKVKWE